jgi:hypothetical protein
MEFKKIKSDDLYEDEMDEDKCKCRLCVTIQKYNLMVPFICLFFPLELNSIKRKEECPSCKIQL